MNKLKYTFFFLLMSGISLAQSNEPNAFQYCLFDGDIGLGGYDPVGYFDQNAALEGDIEITAVHDGVTYQFVSEDNKDKFLKSPTRYLPEFGGWCSMTLAMGQATRPKYDNFIIENDKLYLFERTLSVNGRELWNQNPKQHKKTATNNYKSYKETGKFN